jgi:hypothetical protein
MAVAAAVVTAMAVPMAMTIKPRLHLSKAVLHMQQQEVIVTAP